MTAGMFPPHLLWAPGSRDQEPGLAPLRREGTAKWLPILCGVVWAHFIALRTCGYTWLQIPPLSHLHTQGAIDRLSDLEQDTSPLRALVCSSGQWE